MRLVRVPSSRRESPIMKPVASCGRLFTVNGTSLVREKIHKMLWKGKQCRSLMLKETERKKEKVERSGCIITQCFPLLFFTEQALSLLSRVTPICYLMASLLLVRFPICGQTVPLSCSTEQENIHLLTLIWGTGLALEQQKMSCSLVRSEPLHLSQPLMKVSSGFQCCSL